jgi:hypothetical protein
MPEISRIALHKNAKFMIRLKPLEDDATIRQCTATNCIRTHDYLVNLTKGNNSITSVNIFNPNNNAYEAIHNGYTYCSNHASLFTSLVKAQNSANAYI